MLILLKSGVVFQISGTNIFNKISFIFQKDNSHFSFFGEGVPKARFPKKVGVLSWMSKEVLVKKTSIFACNSLFLVLF